MFVRIGHVFPRCYQDSFLDAFLQVRKNKVCISRKETWKLKHSCEELAANVGIQYTVSFSNNGFFVGKPPKSYQPSQTSESCGTFDVDEICSILKYRKYIFLFDVGSLESSLWDFFGGCLMLKEHMPIKIINPPAEKPGSIPQHQYGWNKPMAFC